MAEPLMDPRPARILHSVAAKMQAKADAELALAQRHYEIACKVIDDTEAAAVRAEAELLRQHGVLIPAPVPGSSDRTEG